MQANSTNRSRAPNESNKVARYGTISDPVYTPAALVPHSFAERGCGAESVPKKNLG